MEAPECDRALVDGSVCDITQLFVDKDSIQTGFIDSDGIYIDDSRVAYYLKPGEVIDEDVLFDAYGDDWKDIVEESVQFDAVVDAVLFDAFGEV
jgi:hypothetical protein